MEEREVEDALCGNGAAEEVVVVSGTDGLEGKGDIGFHGDPGVLSMPPSAGEVDVPGSEKLKKLCERECL